MTAVFCEDEVDIDELKLKRAKGSEMQANAKFVGGENFDRI